MSTLAKTSRSVREGFHDITGGRLKGVRTLVVAFMRLDFIEDMTYPMALLLTELGTIGPLLGYFFVAQLVDDSERVGGDYFTFVAIGMAVAVILQAALSGFGNALQRSQNRGQFELILTEPIPWLFLPLAMNVYRAIYGVFNGALLLVIGVLLGAEIIIGGLLPFIVLVLLGILASMAVGIVAASVMVVAKRSQPLLTLYGLAASLLGGTLFSVDQLPVWLRAFSFAIPHTYVINSARTVLMDDPGTFVITFPEATLALTAFNVVVLGAGLWLFSKSLQFGRREGLLGGY